MKTVKFLFFVLFSAIVSLFATGCSSDDDVHQDEHYEHDAATFKEKIETAQSQGKKYQIIDYRSKAEYEAGHIPGAVWVAEATNQNMGDNSFATLLKNTYGTDSFMFIYGGKNSALMMTLAGSISSAGFGKNHTRALVGGFDAWVKAGYEVEK